MKRWQSVLEWNHNGEIYGNPHFFEGDYPDAQSAEAAETTRLREQYADPSIKLLATEEIPSFMLPYI